jgi:hypothetical protein
VDDFSVKRNRNIAQINWNSMLHGQATYFELQRSEDGFNFNTIQRFNTSNMGKYSSLDDLSSITNKWVHYRLKYIVPSGAFYYSNSQVVYLDDHQQMTLTIAPNPVADRFRVEFKSLIPEQVAIIMKNQTGQVVLQQKMTSSAGMNTWQFQRSGNWTPGTYIVEVQHGTEVLRKRILVQ